jgi:serine/threonine protein phosphatase PrpC
MSMPPEVVFETKINIQAITDVGMSRAHNEDNFIVCPDLSEKHWCLSDHPANLSSRGSLLVVADGMGGANAGEVASEIAVETIRNSFDGLDIEENPEDSKVKDYLYQVILEAHKAIVAASHQNPSCGGMGTTILIAWIFPDRAVFAWVGDSRGYLFRKRGGLKIITNDHSMVWELVEAGKLTPEEADVHPDNNIITQSLGDEDHPPRPDFLSCELEPGDRLLLCSDGLNNMVNHKAIEKILAEGTSLADACQKLVQSANQGGGSDNITVLSLELVENAPKKDARNYLWFLLGLSIAGCLLLGWMLFKAPTPASSDSAPQLNDTYVLQQEVAALEPTAREKLTVSNSEIEVTHAAAEPAPTAVAPELKLALARYDQLNSMLDLRFPDEDFSAANQQHILLSHLDSGDSSITANNKKAVNELVNLAQKYHLGYAADDSARQYFLDYLSGKDKVVIDEVSRELIRMELLINQVKPR